MNGPKFDLRGLRVATARVGYRGPGRILDISRGGADNGRDPVGDAWAPPWKIVNLALMARRRAEQTLELGEAQSAAGVGIGDIEGANQLLRDSIVAAEDINRRAWSAYVPLYEDVIVESRRYRRDAWKFLEELAQGHRRAAERGSASDPVVGLCYCAGHEIEEPRRRCHRFLWAAALEREGAVYVGELSKIATGRERQQLKLGGGW